MKQTDPLAEALRPKFWEAGKRIREFLVNGGVGDASVLYGHLPAAIVQVVHNSSRTSRCFSVHIPTVVGVSPLDPSSIISSVNRVVDDLDSPGKVHQACLYVDMFEQAGPGALANTVRSCVVGLVHAVGHELVEEMVRNAVASLVMNS